MKKIIVILIGLLILTSCNNSKTANGKLNLVTTTTMITDLVKNIAGDAFNLQGLMGSGVDPHLYKASEGDVTKLVNADMIFYNGLHLEGKLVEVFEKMESQNIKHQGYSRNIGQKDIDRIGIFCRLTMIHTYGLILII